MNRNSELGIRIFSISLGVLIIVYTFYLMTSKFFLKGLDFNNLNTLNLNLIKDLNFSGYLIYLIVGYFLFYIGIHWRQIFKALSKSFISFGIIFLSISIILFTINFNSNNLVSSIQPSLDFIEMNFIDKPVNDLINKNNGKSIDLLFLENYSSSKFYVKNITLSQANLLVKALDLNGFTDDEKISFSKVLISKGYTSLKSANSKGLNVAIPLNSLKSLSKKYGVNLSLLNSKNIVVLAMIPVNNEAYLNILLSENKIIDKIILGNISKTQVNKVWKVLKLNEKVSFESKSKIENLMFGEISSIPKLKGMDLSQIPFQTISSLIPNQYRNLLNLDFFSKNISKRVLSLKKLRNICNKKDTNLNFVCDYVKYTNYPYLLKNIKNLTKDLNLSLDNSTISLINDYDSPNKINKLIIDKTNSYKFYFLVFILLLISSFFLYKLNFKVKGEEEISNFKIFYFISKLNLYNIFWNLIFIYIGYYIISRNLVFDFISSSFPSSSSEINVILLLPIYKLILEINSQILDYHLFYFIISLIIFIIFIFIIKKKNNGNTEDIKSNENSVSNEDTKNTESNGNIKENIESNENIKSNESSVNF